MTGTLSNGWTVTSEVDGDGHLNIYIKNADDTDIHEIDTGRGDGRNGEQYALRFTTDGIEQDYQENGDRTQGGRV